MVVAVLALGVGACGGGDDDESQAFQEDFPALSDRIVSLGEQVGNTIEGADNATDQELAQEFDDFAQQLGDLRQQVEDLEPPEDLTDERDDLASAMDSVRTSLEDIANAAEDGDADAAREATLQLIDSSTELRETRRALATAVREGN
jgi:hypothetical protein